MQKKKAKTDSFARYCDGCKDDLLKVCKLGLFLYEIDESVGKGAGHFASKVIDWSNYWSTVKDIIDRKWGEK